MTALFLMTAVHYSWVVPSVDRVSDIMKALGIAAPALFFFAFGYTVPYFLAKPRAEQVRRLTAFFFVAALHNLYMGPLFQLEFLSFLFVCNMIVFVLVRGPQVNLRVTGILAAVFLALLFVLPRGTLSGTVRMVIPGAFAVMPWGLFVLAGLISSRFPPEGRRSPYVPSLLLIALALLLHLGYLVTGSDRLLIARWPVSGSYVLLLVGCCGVWLLAARPLSSALARVPPLARAVALTSRHLLLATVLHYAAVAVVAGGLRLAFTPAQIGRHDVLLIGVGALLTALVAYAILRVVVWAWPLVLRAPAVARAAGRSSLLALVLIPLCAVLTGAADAALEAPGASSAAWLVRDLASPEALVRVGKALTYVVMVYFALVADRAFGKPSPAA